jgi:hypothetical protein
MSEERILKKTERSWFWRIIDVINPLRDPSLTVAVVLTIIEEAGQHDPWYWMVIAGLVNWLAVRGLVWLLVNFTFACTFLARRLWWAIKHPRLAWRILDAIGHEEIVIGGLPTIPEGMLMPDGSSILSLNPAFGGVTVTGELASPQGPVLGLPAGQTGQTGPMTQIGQGTADFSGLPGNSGFFPGVQQAPAYFQSGFYGQAAPSAEGFPQSGSQSHSAEEERLRQQLESCIRLIEDWVQFTEEKWRTVSDSQLGWKPLRGRWSSWDDIFQDTFAAHTSDPLAQAAQDAGEANARRFESAREKGSAASAVACFLRDMMTLRRGMEMLQATGGQLPETSAMQPVVPHTSLRSFGTSGPLRGNTGSGSPVRNSLIRRPAQIFVDADTEK